MSSKKCSLSTVQDNYELLISGDGSHTIKHSQFDAWYHSTHGAITESDIVFIQSNLLHQVKNTERKFFRIFEMGFGTGLNALTSYKACIDHNLKVEYHTVEAYPISSEKAMELNYGSLLGYEAFYNDIHKAAWETEVVIDDRFSIHKYRTLVEDLEIPQGMDAVYFDAFSPADQEHLWQKPILSKMYNCLVKGGILTTYCAQGEFRRQLISCGFKVERIPGPPYKRQMIRATK